MSEETNDKFISLLLETGDKFENIPLTRSDVSLREFLDAALKALENESRIQLPDTDDLIDPEDFKVYDHTHSHQLDLSLTLKDEPYFIRCRNSGTTPKLLLVSTIFRNAQQLEREGRVDAALRRQNTDGSMQTTPPVVPERVSSLHSSVTKDQDLLYLSGRKPYIPPSSSVTKGPQLTISTSSSSLTSEGAGFPSGPSEGDTMNRLFNGSSVSLAISDDSISIHSSTSDYVGGAATTPEAVRRNLLRPMSAPGQGQSSVRSGSSSGPDSPNPPRSRSQVHRPLRSTRSTPPPTIEERVGLDQISEENTDDNMSPARQSRRSSQGSLPALMEPSSSSTSTSTTTTSTSFPKSPQSQKKRRVAQSRRQKKRNDADLDMGGAGEGHAEGESHGPPSSIRRNQRTIYAKSRVFSSGFFPLRVFGNIKTFTVEFHIQYVDLIVQMEVRGDYTVGQIKDNLWASLREQGALTDEFGNVWDPECFTFTYEMNKEKYELYDEQQIFQMAKVIQLWRSENREQGVLMVEEKLGEGKEEKTLNMEISAMIGIGLYQLQFANNDELDITRRKMVAVRRNAVKSRDPVQYCMETDVTFQTIPPHILKYLNEDKILIRVYYALGEDENKLHASYQTVQVEMSLTADELVSMMFPDSDVKKQRYNISPNCNPDDCVLKVTGQDSYLHGYHELKEFSYIVKCVSKKIDIELVLVRKLKPEMDKPREIEDCNLIDDATGETGSHSDLSALTKEHVQVFTLSMWDIPRKFRVRIVGLDNIRNPDCEVLYVEAGVYHGGELLGGAKFSSEVGVTPYPRWNQWLVFETPIRCLPKAARLCLQVVGGNRQKDVKKKSMRSRKSLDKKGEGQFDKSLHWVNMQILDHRSLLQQGLIRLNLWPVFSESLKGPISSQTSPMGSTAINPDGNNSAVLYIELDTYAHPVACPTHGWGEDIVPPSDTVVSSFKKELDVIIHTDPLTKLEPPEKELLWKYRGHCSTIPEALPKVLRCVNWGDLEMVTEIQRLLRIWRPITLEVALELLDYHFADEKVRTLAVKRIQKLSNDELQSFLLQLVQVLKFESYHDSALARLLLNRALRSKRIGHYFYWYLRSEMDTPEFNQRFGILLEAYLRGCGEAMFREIQNQHKAVCDVMQVAASIKRQFEKNKGDYARESLAKYEFPKSFSPPYDPFVTMGNVSISKCRVMDSKKTPLWLEFENMDFTDVSKKPIKVIAKHGDDLRQDMLTLQMLALMDKMWQANGLDLHIIPYGCIATGNMMGMIQVVQDAETVAKIQVNHGGTFSALKEEPLHDWLKKQNQTQARFEAAVERFTLSCAGYCVATYILGIGDRHNDNVMVTKSGNLFHIDFGHFLGNKKYFMGYSREKAPFVLTPDFEYVMGKRNSDTFRRFETTAVKAYMIIRKNANLLINLFSMMKCTGIPELQNVEDLEYLRNVFVLGRTNEEAEEHFRGEIHKCLKLQWSTQLNWFTHNIVHRN